MTCDDAKEFLSALCDGETIPSTAAEHISICSICRSLLQEYLEIGVELRRIASLETSQAVAPQVWNKQCTLEHWWQKGWQTMRIPRLVFASLLAAVILLGSGLAVVGVRAHSEGTVLLLKIPLGTGDPALCALSTVEKKLAKCAIMGRAKSGMLSSQFEFLSRDGDRVTLGIRTAYNPSTSHATFEDTRSLPERQYTFEPGETLQIDVEGLGPLAITGEWMDHMPSLTFKNQELDPGPEELRIVSPLLLRYGEVVGDLEGASTALDKPGQGVVFQLKGEGRFVFASSAFDGATQGHVRLNRIAFEVNGTPYLLLTGTPITRGKEIWVRYDPASQISGDLAGHTYLGGIDLNHLAAK